MVQDIWDSEIFIASSPSGSSGLLVENSACAEDTRATLAERLPVYLVSPPGETLWARGMRLPSEQAASCTADGLPRMKRGREEENGMDAEAGGNDTEMTGTTQSPESAQVAHVSRGAQEGQEKRSRGASALETGRAAGTIGLNLPVPGQQGSFAVVAKVYDGEVGRGLRVNTLVHVVGVLQDALEIGGEGEFVEEIKARNPGIVKRLHVVKMRELKEWEANPAIAGLGERIGGAREELMGVLGGLRDVCVKYFASALGGDRLAGEYLLMGMLSRPVVRIATGVMGKLCVNLVVPEGGQRMGEGVVGALERVFARVVRVGVNIAGLNAGEWYAKKDYELNRVKAGVLQLPVGCVMVGDETGMSDGRLSERGVRNVKAIKKVIEGGMMPIDFQYYEAEAPVGCCAVLVSKGGKSIVGGDVVVKVEECAEGLVGWGNYEEELVNKLRMMLGLLAEDGEFDIEDDAARLVEEQFVIARRQGTVKNGQDGLHGWLAVARSCARSFGERKLTVERWKYAWALEQERCKRMTA
eukprot:GFKZ01001325.1.p1 GENE.GFKZ01001325.1~~GFKZ01001325.1.p1  ORF type:complete len:526 (+),score=98.50 GFKZ01001325.1:201-1778(+)